MPWDSGNEPPACHIQFEMKAGMGKYSLIWSGLICKVAYFRDNSIVLLIVLSIGLCFATSAGFFLY